MKYISLVVNSDSDVIVAAFELQSNAMQKIEKLHRKSQAAYDKAGRPKYHRPHRYKLLTIPYFPKHIKKDPETNDLLIQEGF